MLLGLSLLSTVCAMRKKRTHDITSNDLTTKSTPQTYPQPTQSSLLQAACDTTVAIRAEKTLSSFGQGLMGTYDITITTPPSANAGRPVYKHRDENYYLYYWNDFSKWRIGRDHTAASAWADGSSNSACPGGSLSWWHDSFSHWVDNAIAVGKVCDPSVAVAAAKTLSTFGQSMMGVYVGFTATTAASPNAGRPVYKHKDESYYLYYWNQFSKWRIGSDYNTASGWASGFTASSVCPEPSLGSWWDSNFNAWVDNAIAVGKVTTRLVSADGHPIAGKTGLLQMVVDGIGKYVCDDAFDNNGARVACRELGYAVANPLVADGVAHADSFYDDVTCTGSESKLTECRRSSYENCGKSEAITLTCTEAR